MHNLGAKVPKLPLWAKWVSRGLKRKKHNGHTVSRKDTVSVSHIRSPLFLQKLDFYTDKCDACH